MKFLPLTLVLAALPTTALADTIGLWRFDDAGAAAGAEITTAANTASPGTLDAQAGVGIPVYSDDVPAAMILDPVAGETYANAFSLDASGSDAQVFIADAAELNSSFTVEFFIKLIGEPGSYESVLRRREFADRNWQVDFDHGANQAFGRLRSRWDTPAGEPDGIAEVGVDENVNFVLGPQGNAGATKIYVDTGAKDEFGVDVGAQNTGDPQDYIFDAASVNPNEQDVALQGDGTNDIDSWHHVAVSFDQDSGEIKFYFDYELMQTRTLADTEADGYTHPAADLFFGKLSTGEYGLLLDELRYSNAILTPANFLRDASIDFDFTIAFWRMEENGAADGAEILEVANSASDTFPATPNNGTPTYSSDVPGSTILDPVSMQTYPNQFSLDASTANSRLAAGNDTAFNTSFTFEMFMKLEGEPGGYHAFVRRSQASDLRWQIDFDHAATGAFGRIRTRFDTPAGEPDNLAEQGVDENVNFVVGATGGASIPGDQRLWIDTPTGDGNPASYVSADWADDGDGTNDNLDWHHVALTFDENSGTVSFYFDYELMQTRTLSDSQMDGYTHPSAAILFGKLANSGYGMWMDELRYSGKVLQPSEFLQVMSEPEAELEILDITYDRAAGESTIVWRSVPGQRYGLDRSFDLRGIWFEQLEDELATDDTSTYTDTALPDGTTRAYYRVRKLE